jgi:hypothetical protein
MFHKKQKVTDEEFEEWQLEHDCDINFVGSSPAMQELLYYGKDQYRLTISGTDGWLVMLIARH